VQLGGSDDFIGARRERAVIGAEFDDARTGDIVRAARLMVAAAVTVLAAVVAVIVALGQLRAFASPRRR
jgi:cobalamin biosynthesis protein CobD/CbiB